MLHIAIECFFVGVAALGGALVLVGIIEQVRQEAEARARPDDEFYRLDRFL